MRLSWWVCWVSLDLKLRLMELEGGLKGTRNLKQELSCWAMRGLTEED